MSESRRSARISAKNKPPLSMESETKECTQDKEFRPTTRPERKRTKVVKRVDTSAGDEQTPEAAADLTVAAVPKKKKGKLANLPDMPLDVLYEVFRHLHPLDILRLSRLTKALRAVLLKRSARSVWVDALALIPDLPPCPPDMQEPQWVRLVFDKHCFFCGGFGAKSVLWVHRVRTCKKCLTENTIDGEPGPFMSSHDYSNFLPWVTSKYSGRGYRPYRYLRKEFEEVKKHCDSLNDQGAIDTYLEELKQETRRRENDPHVHKCDVWLSNCRSEREDELELVREQRKIAVLDRFRELGFGRDVDWISQGRWGEGSDLTCHKLLRISKPLTPHAWEKIRPVLTPIVERLHKQRIKSLELNRESERLSMIRRGFTKYCATVDDGALAPVLADICNMDSFRSILQLPFEDTDVDVVTETSFAAPFAQLPEAVTQWQRKRELHLVNLLHHYIADKGLDPYLPEGDGRELPSFMNNGPYQQFSEEEEVEKRQRIFTLALAVFKCSCSSDIRTTKAILEHRCSSWVTVPSDQKPYLGAGSFPWNFGDVVSTYEAINGHIRSIVTQCELDPVVATRSDLDTIDARFTCSHLSCAEDGKQRAFNWRHMVVHMRSYHQGAYSATPVRLSREKEDAVRALELALPLNKCEWSSPLNCAHCSKCKDMYRGGLILHLRTEHDIQEPTWKDSLFEQTDSFTSSGPNVDVPLLSPSQDS